MDLSTRVVVLEYGRNIADDVPDSQADPKVIDAYLGVAHRGRDAKGFRDEPPARDLRRPVRADDLGARPAVQTIWEDFVGGVLYSLIALGFVLIFKASGIFNFAQGIMMVFAALTLVGLHEKGVPAWIALLATIGSCMSSRRHRAVVLRPLVNQPDIMLLMATFGITYFLIGFGELVFGGNPKSMITQELLLPSGALDFRSSAAPSRCKTRYRRGGDRAFDGRHARPVFPEDAHRPLLARGRDDHQAALSVGISLNQISVVVWFAAGVVALATGIMRTPLGSLLRAAGGRAEGAAGADSRRPDLHSRRDRRRPHHRHRREARRVLLEPTDRSGIESWLAYFIALAFLLFRPQGLFGERIIERIY